jgi:hypothetical protein
MGTCLEILGTDEMIDLGRDVRAGWHLPVVVAARAKRQAAIFDMASDGLDTDAMTHITVRHGPPMVTHGELWGAYGIFNARLTDAMEAMKRAMGFTWWLTAMHPRWDADAKAFDLHAHIVGWLPMERHGAAMEVLGRFFAKPWIRTDETKDATATARYPAAGLTRDVNASLPLEALRALADAPKGVRLIRTAREVRKLAREAEERSQPSSAGAKVAKPRPMRLHPEKPGVRAVAVVTIAGEPRLARVVRYQASPMLNVDTFTREPSQLPNSENPGNPNSKP